MLVLERRIGQRIRINDDIVLTVVDIRKGHKVRIGIDAPEHIVIHREEVYDAIHRYPPHPPAPEAEA